MAIGERSITDVLQDIAGNVQEIVRSEIQLARSELLAQANKVKAAAPMLVAGGLALAFASLFAIWTCLYALSLVVPIWAAALIVTAGLVLIGSIALAAGLKTLRRISPPERTIASVKENVQWAKQQVK